MLVVFPFLWIFFCVVSGMYAHFHCNRNGIGWFFVAFLFSPLVAFVLLLVLPSAPPVAQDNFEARQHGPVSDTALMVIIGGAVVIALVIGIALTSKSASAQQQVIRDASGRVVVTATQSGNQTTYRDSGGRSIGTSTFDSVGTSVLRDASGRTVGTINGRK